MTNGFEPNCVPDQGLTHAGVFHADEVFATALLTMLNSHIKITRANTVPADFAGIVYDVGGGEFDHHQGKPKERPNGVPFSSLGLLWRHYGTLLLNEDDAQSFDESFVQPIDLADNTGAPSAMSMCISDFNPRGASSPEDFERCFWKAVAWARQVLERRFASLDYARASVSYVRQQMKVGDGKVLVLDEPVPWKASLVGSGYTYVVYPSPRGLYNAQCVPQRLGDGSMVLPFPDAWRGKPSHELRLVTGVSDAEFCHASGFLCSAASLHGAKELAYRSLAQGV